MVLIFALTVIVFFLLYFGPYRNPGWLSPGFAGVALPVRHCGLRHRRVHPRGGPQAVRGLQRGAGQPGAARETFRRCSKQGYLESGLWTKAFVAKTLSRVMVDGDDESVPAEIDGDRLLKLPTRTASAGRGPVPPPLQRLPRRRPGLFGGGPVVAGMAARRWSARRSTIFTTCFFMPPWCGTPQEAELITDYLMSIARIARWA